MKKFTALLLTTAMLTTVSVFNVSAESNTDTETEPNNIFSQAQQIVENQVVSGDLSEEDVIDFYTFTLEKRQRLTLYRNVYLENDPAYGYMSYLDINLYKNHNMLSDEETEYKNIGWNCNDKNGVEWDESTVYILDAGTYQMSLNYADMSYEDVYELMFELSDPEPVLAYEYTDFRFDFDGVKKLNYISTNETIELNCGEKLDLKVVDGEVVQWKNETPKKLKVTKKGRVTALAQGYGYVTAVLASGEEIKCTVDISGNPEFTYKNKPTTYVTLKKGETKQIGIENGIYKIKKIYKGNRYVKVTGKAKAYGFKIKGLKKGISTIKVKINRNWYTLTVKVK